MKANKYIIVVIFVLFTVKLNAQAHDEINKIIICLGDRNSDLNELNYKTLHFYYTPKLKVVENVLTNNFMVKGSPKILEEWSDTQDLMFHSLLFDKNGYVAWEGTLDTKNNILNSKGYNNISLKEAIKKYNDKTNTITTSDRTLTFYSNQSVYRGKYYHYPFVGKQIVHFFVYDKSYKSYSVKSLIETGKPTFLIFFYYKDKATISEEEVIYKQSINSSDINGLKQQNIKIENVFSILETIL